MNRTIIFILFVIFLTEVKAIPTRSDCYDDITETVHLKCGGNLDEIKKCAFSLKERKNNVKYLHIIGCEASNLIDFIKSFENRSEFDISTNDLKILKSQHSKRLKRRSSDHETQNLVDFFFNESKQCFSVGNVHVYEVYKTPQYNLYLRIGMPCSNENILHSPTPTTSTNNIESDESGKTVEDNIIKLNTIDANKSEKIGQGSIWTSQQLQTICIVIIVILSIILFVFIGFLMYDYRIYKAKLKQHRMNAKNGLRRGRIEATPNDYVI